MVHERLKCCVWHLFLKQKVKSLYMRLKPLACQREEKEANQVNIIFSTNVTCARSNKKEGEAIFSFSFPRKQPVAAFPLFPQCPLSFSAKTYAAHVLEHGNKNNTKDTARCLAFLLISSLSRRGIGGGKSSFYRHVNFKRVQVRANSSRLCKRASERGRLAHQNFMSHAERQQRLCTFFMSCTRKVRRSLARSCWHFLHTVLLNF